MADDLSGSALLPNADQLLSQTLNSKLDGLAAQHAEAVADEIADIMSVDILRSKVTTTGEDSGTSKRSISTHDRDIDRDTRRTINGVKEGIGRGYYAHRVEKAGTGVDKLEVRIQVAALLRVDGTVAEIEETATKFVQSNLAKYAVEIKNTTGATRDAYRKVQEQSAEKEALTIDLRANEVAGTKDDKGADLPTYSGHVFADSSGKFPASLNEWESQVVNTEIGRKSFIAWLRNPSRSMSNSLRIPYTDDAGKWQSLQIDFIVISRRSDGQFAASIVDPHGDHLADAKVKLRALADFAEDYGGQFLRIESIAKVSDGSLRSLELQDSKVRNAIREFEGGKVSALYTSDVSAPYV